MKRIITLIIATLAFTPFFNLSAQTGHTPFAYMGQTNMMGYYIEFNQPIPVPTTPDSVMIIEYIYAVTTKSSACMIALDHAGRHVDLAINNLPTHLVVSNGDKVSLFRPKHNDQGGVNWYVSGYTERVR